MIAVYSRVLRFFFFNDTATTEIYTLSLHDALPICQIVPTADISAAMAPRSALATFTLTTRMVFSRSEEHTSELQSQSNLVCRLLLEKKKKLDLKLFTRYLLIAIIDILVIDGIPVVT